MSILGIQLESWNLGATKTFYASLLGFTLVEDAPESFAVSAGETKLVFAQAQPGTQPSYRLTFGIAADQFAQTVSQILQRLRLIVHQGQTTILSPVTGTSAVYGYDAAGNLLEFASMASAAPGIRGITGIGLVVDDLDAAVADLQQGDLAARAQVSSDPQIRVLRAGDHISLVLTKRGAVWFPGRRPAQVHQMILTLPGEVNSVTKVLDYPYFIHRGSGWYTLRG